MCEEENIVNNKQTDEITSDLSFSVTSVHE